MTAPWLLDIIATNFLYSQANIQAACFLKCADEDHVMKSELELPSEIMASDWRIIKE